MYARVDFLGGQPIDATSTTNRHYPGFRIRAQDPVYGDGDFVYVLASTAVGAAQSVAYNVSTGSTVLATTRSRGQFGVAVVAIPAGSYGWLQVRGAAIALVTGTVTAGANVFTTATPGTLSTTPVAGDQVYGATSASASGTPAAGQALISLNAPFLGDTDNA